MCMCACTVACCVLHGCMRMCVTTVTVSVLCVCAAFCACLAIAWLAWPAWLLWLACLPSRLFLFCSFYCLFSLTVPFTVSFHCFLYCFFIHCFSYCSFFTVPFPFLLLFPKTVLKKKPYCSFLLRLFRSPVPVFPVSFSQKKNCVPCFGHA